MLCSLLCTCFQVCTHTCTYSNTYLSTYFDAMPTKLLKKRCTNSVKSVKNENSVIYSSSCWYKPKYDPNQKKGSK